MPVYKCKVCGGTIVAEQGAKSAECKFCGSMQVLPSLSDDRRSDLYDRADLFLRGREFDKAAEIYEQILNMDITDAKAYWSLVLCRYGVEYVEEPNGHNRVPAVNRTRFTPVFEDEYYKAALFYADPDQRRVYEEEGNKINEIQKGILVLSQKEEPYDVFINCKETDANGKRTRDSVLAADMYHQLTREGIRVFYAPITLADKIGFPYESCVFNAMDSSRVMIVLGTRPEYFNDVWLKNKWQRYLSMADKSGGKKILIPAYRDMEVFDLPRELSYIQTMNMSDLGFMQDLIRCIRKIIKKENGPVYTTNPEAKDKTAAGYFTDIPAVKAYTGKNNYIFISYSHKDKEKVYPFIEALQKKYNVWFDDGIHLSSDYEEEIADRLKNCSLFIYMVSKQSLSSLYCRKEIKYADSKSKNFLNIVLEPDIEFPGWFSLGYEIYQMFGLYGFSSYENAISELERKCGWFEPLKTGV